MSQTYSTTVKDYTERITKLIKICAHIASSSVSQRKKSAMTNENAEKMTNRQHQTMLYGIEEESMPVMERVHVEKFMKNECSKYTK